MVRPIPIIKLHEVLIVPIHVELTDELVLALKDDIANAVRDHDVTSLVIEVSGLDVFDSFMARAVSVVARLARMMGVRTLLAGLSPAIATTLVEMGMEMPGVEASLNLEAALEDLGYGPRRASAARDGSKPV